MNFTLDTEQQLLQDSVRRFIARDYHFEARTAALQSGATCSAERWNTYAENGWLSAALPEQHGGLGGSILDSVLIAHELGRALVLEPYLGCAILATQTFMAAATPAQLDQWLGSLIDGSRKLALAYSETHSRGMLHAPRLSAVSVDGGYRLRGIKTLVLGGMDADTFVLSACLQSSPSGSGVTGLLLVDATCPGLTRRALPLHDGSWAAELEFDDVFVDAQALLGEPASAQAALEHGLAQATAVLCAELVGGMEKAIELTADYLKVRHQFGVAIGSFQALQHRMADMAADLELSRSMLFSLLASIENDDAGARQFQMSQTKALIGRAAKRVCGQAIQLHGGIGMTEEYSVGHYFKRAVVADLLLGSSDQHEALCAQQLQQALRA